MSLLFLALGLVWLSGFAFAGLYTYGYLKWVLIHSRFLHMLRARR